LLRFRTVLLHESEVGIYEKFAKMYQWFQEKITPRSNFAENRLSAMWQWHCVVDLHNLPVAEW